MRNGLSALFSDGPSPHLQSLPSSKSIEKLQILDLQVECLLLCPFPNIKKGMRLATDILTESFLADSVILETCLSLMLPDELELDELQFVYVLLLASDQIEELVDVIHPAEDQSDVLVQTGLGLLDC